MYLLIILLLLCVSYLVAEQAYERGYQAGRLEVLNEDIIRTEALIKRTKEESNGNYSGQIPSKDVLCGAHQTLLLPSGTTRVRESNVLAHRSDVSVSG